MKFYLFAILAGLLAFAIGWMIGELLNSSLNHKKKKKKVKIFGDIVVFVLLFASVIALGLSVYFYFDEAEIKVSSTEEIRSIDEVVKDCGGMDIFDSAVCVNQYVENIYKYNVSNIERDMKFSLLKEEGGVCSHWATLYCYFGDKFGFNTEKVTVDSGEDDYLVYNGNNTPTRKTYSVQHMFCVWSNEKGYVVLDQTNMFKFQFKNDDELEVIMRYKEYER